MKTLFLIDGAAGAGKSDLIKFISTNHKYKATTIGKYTTREKRALEEARKSDLTFVSEKTFNDIKKESKEGFYEYSYGGFNYGFKKTDLDSALDDFQFVFIIIRRQELISELMEDYAAIAKVVSVYIYSDRSLIEERLRADGADEETIKFRLERSESVFKDYIENDLYEYVIINSSNETDFHKKIKELLQKHDPKKESANELFINPSTAFRLVTPLEGYKKTIERQLQRYPYERNVFLMMKFRASNKSVGEFIKTELAKAGYNCVMANDESWNITNTTFNPVAVLYCCKYGIALFDEPEDGANFNPNVAYELGIMHNQNKKCLILMHSSLKNTPFDLVKDLHEPYTKEIEFQQILKRWLISIKNG